MQEEQALPDTPERCGAELVPTGGTLVNTVRQTRTHVVEREIRERLVGYVAHASEDRTPLWLAKANGTGHNLFG